MADFTRSRKNISKPMVLYIPQQAVEAVNDLLSKLPDDREEGVSVDGHQ